MKEELAKWAKEFNLKMTLRSEKIVGIGESNYLLSDKDYPFRDNGVLDIDEGSKELLKNNKLQGVIYMFGGEFCYSPRTCLGMKEIFPLADLGPSMKSNGTPFLGVHGENDVRKGLYSYDKWVSRAKFLGYSSLGIAEHSTMSGVIEFYHACKKGGIAPVLGVTYSVAPDGDEGQIQSNFYEAKVYAVGGDEGLRHLTKLHNDIAEAGGNIVSESLLLAHASRHLSVAITPSKHSVKTATIKKYMGSTFNSKAMQISAFEKTLEIEDVEVLQSLKKYLRDGKTELMQPIWIEDAYCLYPTEESLLPTMESMSGSSLYQKGRHFSGRAPYYKRWMSLFSEEDQDWGQRIFKAAINNTKAWGESLAMEIDLMKRHLPKFAFPSQEVEDSCGGDSVAYYDKITNSALEDYIKSNPSREDEARERFAYENEIIKMGDIVDYLLVVRAGMAFCKDNDIQAGPGRGSSAGSFIVYLLGIVAIDPLEFGLIFERFVNPSRLGLEMVKRQSINGGEYEKYDEPAVVGENGVTSVDFKEGYEDTGYKGLADVDVDFASNMRGEVIDFYKEAYGRGNVCQVGTLSKFKIKAAFQDLSKHYGAYTPAKVNMLSANLVPDGPKDMTWCDMIQKSTENEELRGIVVDNSDLVSDMKTLLNGAAKTRGVHPCATVIVPIDEQGRGLEYYIPCRREDGQLIAEWSGGILEDMGFLKLDLLGTKQQQKIAEILDLVEARYGKRLNIDDIDIEEDEVFEQFHEGFTNDVFQFGSQSFIPYMKKLKPTKFEHLVAASALYRPGPMAMNAHTDYIALKNGEMEPDYQCEEMKAITGETYGLLVYQEQAMRCCVELGGMSMVDADGVRKAMGKKIQDKMDSYEIMFVKGCAEKGIEKEIAEEIWDTIAAFGAYSFNLSHSVAYSKIGYQCQWLKHHYPLEFWAVALHHADEKKDLPNYIREIQRSGKIALLPPDVNNSKAEFTYDSDTDSIFWAITKVRKVAEKSANAVMEDRAANGEFKSIRDFVSRLGSKVNIAVLENLALSGAFDALHGVTRPAQRLQVMEEVIAVRQETSKMTQKMADTRMEPYTDNVEVYNDYFWTCKQVEVSGLGYIDYSEVLATTRMHGKSEWLVDSEEFSQNHDLDGKQKIVGGIVRDVVIKKSKKGDFATITLDANHIQQRVRIWGKEWSNDGNVKGLVGMRDAVMANKGNIIFFRGKVEGPSKWYSENCLIVNGVKGHLWALPNYEEK